MSWHCQMVGLERRCIEWSVYTKTGWDINQSFVVTQIDGVLKKLEEECVTHSRTTNKKG